MTEADRAFVIAEAGVNHNGSLAMALRLIDVAADAGADAIKFQTFRADRLASRFAPKAQYQLDTTDSGESQLEMLRKLELDDSAHEILLNRCRDRGIEFMSTPFDNESLRFLVDKIGVQRLKIASGEITNGPLLLEAARSGKPVLLSTGMSTIEEIEDALGVLAFGLTTHVEEPSHHVFRRALVSPEGIRALRGRVTVLHCVTEYPAPFLDVNLRAIQVIRDRFPVNVGYSDHTLGISISLAAVAVGATVLEKHFTLDKSLPGPDHRASLDPLELKALMKGVREIGMALGVAQKRPSPSELKNLAVARKSLVAACEIRAGERYSAQNLSAKRPGNGISPMRFWDVIGRPATRDFAEDEPIE
jgi:N-acetylneuraminate synthase